MASAEILDFEALLAPISDEQPSGPELKDDAALSTIYYQVKDAREAARSAERSILQAWGEAEEMDRVEPPDWEVVIELATDVLKEKSKDLWIAAWLVEGLCRIHGYAGLRDGFRLIREISEKYWDGIHPEPDEDGYATTVAQITGLNGEEGGGALLTPIKSIAITAEGTYPGFSVSDFEMAQELESLDPPEVERRVAAGGVSMEMFQTGVRETSAPFFKALIEDIEAAMEEYSAMSKLLEEKCGEDEWGYSLAPPTSAITETFQDCKSRIDTVAADTLAMAAPTEEEASSEGGDWQTGGESGGAKPQAGGGVAVQTGVGVIATREDAFRALLKISEYFRKNEPHSIVSYSIDQIVRWGRMSLPELLKELIADDSARTQMFTRTGIPADGGGSGWGGGGAASSWDEEPASAPEAPPAKDSSGEDSW